MGVAIVRPRNPDGTWGDPQKFGNGETDAEKIERLENENALSLYESMMKDVRIGEMEAAQSQSDVIQAEILYALMNGGIL